MRGGLVHGIPVHGGLRVVGAGLGCKEDVRGCGLSLKGDTVMWRRAGRGAGLGLRCDSTVRAVHEGGWK